VTISTGRRRTRSSAITDPGRCVFSGRDSRVPFLISFHSKSFSALGRLLVTTLFRFGCLQITEELLFTPLPQSSSAGSDSPRAVSKRFGTARGDHPQLYRRIALWPCCSPRRRPVNETFSFVRTGRLKIRVNGSGHTETDIVAAFFEFFAGAFG